MNTELLKSKIKTIILCGGLGTRLAEDTKKIPKPMIRIGNQPMLLHIMKLYNIYNFKNFLLATGYKSEIIEKYFEKKKNKFNFNISCVYTGAKTMTGGRILKLKKFFNKKEIFMVTYGDGLSNVNLTKLLKFHLKHKKIATMTVVRPPARFGIVNFYLNKLIRIFEEKPQISEGWINGGFFVFDYRIFKYIKNSKTMLEKYTFQKLVNLKQIAAYEHFGYWQCMDTLRDKILLNKLNKRKIKPWIKK
jgi:glucose-1-phosphate cytidylyltransferase